MSLITTRQELFNTAVLRLREQGKLCVAREDYAPAYQNEAGCRCIIGGVMPKRVLSRITTKYNYETVEGLAKTGPAVAKHWIQSFGVGFLHELQLAHDHAVNDITEQDITEDEMDHALRGPKAWSALRSELQAFAKKWDLDPFVLDHWVDADA